MMLLYQELAASGLPQGLSYNKRPKVRPSVYILLLFCLVLFGVARAYAVYSSAEAQNKLTAATLPLPLPRTHKPLSSNPAPVLPITLPQHVAPAIVSPTPVIPVTRAVVIPSAPACTPDTAFSTPATLDLTNAPAGLTQVVDPIHYYQIYGYNSSQVRQQIINCAPKLSGDEDFTGYTVYRLNWQYSYGVNSGGTCSVSNAKVGMHISEVLPAWQRSNYADAGFASKWQAFVPDLNTHEQGHIALNEQYAADLVGTLQAITAPDCSTIEGTVSAAVNAKVAALNQANQNYDAQTNHGATQGAIIP